MRRATKSKQQRALSVGLTLTAKLFDQATTTTASSTTPPLATSTATLSPEWLFNAALVHANDSKREPHAPFTADMTTDAPTRHRASALGNVSTDDGDARSFSAAQGGFSAPQGSPAAHGDARSSSDAQGTVAAQGSTAAHGGMSAHGGAQQAAGSVVLGTIVQEVQLQRVSYRVARLRRGPGARTPEAHRGRRSLRLAAPNSTWLPLLLDTAHVRRPFCTVYASLCDKVKRKFVRFMHVLRVRRPCCTVYATK